MWRTQFIFAILVVLGVAGGRAWAANPLTPGDKKVHLHDAYRASKIIGMAVKNTAEEKVGSIDDLVIDLHNGKVRYAALAVGGFLGIGEKLFAVPWDQLTLKQAGNDVYFLFDVDKEKLRKAPGFDKDKWPEVGSEDFASEIDKYYGKTPRGKSKL